LPVTDLPGAGGVDDGLGKPDGVVVVGEHLDADLRHEVDAVLGAPVHLGVPPLAAEATGLGDGHAADPELGEGLLHLVELERLDQGGDELQWDLADSVLGSNGRPYADAGTPCGACPPPVWVRTKSG